MTKHIVQFDKIYLDGAHANILIPGQCVSFPNYETAQRFLICAELAGMKGDEIDIRADGGELHIRGTRKKPHLPGGDKEESVSVHLMEIDSGRFHRKVPIPDGVDIEQITATYKHGYLWIALPRK